ncbi:alpha/beta hydrolase [Photobacterium galatheae]|uniref:Carboxylesterase n=1 Tax=Photobacterium galatheae TaxID=1654360 RepID=A0A066RT67_9GAMM|nr:alpha/beta hydrolase [Photobacterium galatheae]KDM92286.1 carboxylesterase [Photobacterium galatheae]MCM0150533.1 alpha/beta hydrolase [Photobacterium galatheae]
MMDLNQTLRVWLSAYHEALAQLAESGVVPSPDAVRDGLAALTSTFVTDAPDVAVLNASVASQEEKSEQIPVRIYHPAPESALPVIVFLHGGGHMAGSVAVYDRICRKLAASTQHLVVSVDYRLAPEHPYPAGLTDARQVIMQLWPLLDRYHLRYSPMLSLVGDSAGGAMTATLSAEFQQNSDITIANQVLIYPSLDYTMSQPSVVENGQGLFLQREKMRWYFDHYFRHEEDRQAASPLWMPMTSRMPRTLVITAQYCPLRDEGMAYVQKLLAVGVKAQHFHLDDMIHAYLNLENMVPEQCAATYRQIAVFLNGPNVQ